MKIFLITACVMLIAFGGMAIGVIAGRGALKGGCGRAGGACDGHCASRCERHDHVEEN